MSSSTEIRLTLRAEEQIVFRKLSRVRVIDIAKNPEQIKPRTSKRFFAQSRYWKVS